MEWGWIRRRETKEAWGIRNERNLNRDASCFFSLPLFVRHSFSLFTAPTLLPVLQLTLVLPSSTRSSSLNPSSTRSSVSGPLQASSRLLWLQKQLNELLERMMGREGLVR